MAAAVLAVTVAACGSAPAGPPSATRATPATPENPATPAATPRPTDSPTSSASAATSARPSPSETPAPTSLAGQTIPFTIDVQQPLDQTIPAGSTVTNLPDGGVRADSARASDGSIYLMWKLDPATLPAGASIANVETLVCGRGDGDFYEVYGPQGAEEIEYEVTAPASDGCWHFTKDPGTDYRVEIYVNDDSTMTISRIEYRITFR